ncbi:glycosyl transferase family 2 [Fibrobacterales bacterium]|nr:glycosyl transferase family 2 [Fibrobacterales bacterium]
MKHLDGISIVIATKGRVKFLEELLESVYLARNNFSDKSEVILVDDSSEKDVIEIEKICEKYMAKRIYHSPSVAEKRNVGVREAKYDIVLFLDSDCIATPNLLNEHKKLYIDERIGGVAGLLEFVGEDTWFWNAVSKSHFVINFQLPRILDEVSWTPTANCSVRKDIFNLVGGFDNSFPNKPGGEDVDFGIRMTKKGFIIKCSKEGVVYHSKKTWSSVKDMVKRVWHYGSANYYLISNHPEQTTRALPKKPVIAIAILFLSIIMAFITPYFLLSFLIWVTIDFIVENLFIYRFANYTNSTFVQQIIVRILININELGYIWRCIVKKRFSYIHTEFLFSPNQLYGILRYGAINVWSNLITFIIMLLMIFISLMLI